MDSLLVREQPIKLAIAVGSELVEEPMQERSDVVDHCTIQRWAVHYAPSIEKAFRENKNATSA